MNNSTPTAQSGPSAVATVVGFDRGLPDLDWTLSEPMNKGDKLYRHPAPPAGARDAVTDDMVESALVDSGIAYRNAGLLWIGQRGDTEIDRKQLAGIAAALTGKADDPQEIMPPSHEPKTERDVRRALAELHREYQERCQPFVDILVKIEANKPPTMAWMLKATQPAAPGAGEGGE